MAIAFLTNRYVTLATWMSLAGCQLAFPLVTVDASADGSVDASSEDFGVACGLAGVCSGNGIACCLFDASSSCMNDSLCNEAGGTQVTCDDQADCPGQSFPKTWTRCCVRPGRYAAQCYLPSDASSGCGPGDNAMCNPALGDTECTAGTHCSAYAPLPGYYACQ
jgi:hypothetical protein